MGADQTLPVAASKQSDENSFWRRREAYHAEPMIWIGWEKRESMASTVGAIAALATFSTAVRIPKPLLFPEHRPPHSFPSNCSSTHCSSPFLSIHPLPPPSPPLGRKWKPLAVALEDAPPVEDTPEPEPVEVQIEAAVATANSKGEDVFAVVMIGSRQYIVIPGRFIYTQRLKGANVNDKAEEGCLHWHFVPFLLWAALRGEPVKLVSERGTEEESRERSSGE
ncbi:hypothetical protein KSP39_PZI013616 [Platanthera zijinensis]|uniref:Uncharacterized protein n=1 Tax=Platanthera zijinensis TaxID=2320716 RepID=A0AAP0BDJ8_9ASPA